MSDAVRTLRVRFLTKYTAVLEDSRILLEEHLAEMTADERDALRQTLEGQRAEIQKERDLLNRLDSRALALLVLLSPSTDRVTPVEIPEEHDGTR